MKVACPYCQQALRIPDDWAGKTAKCQHCKQPFLVPGDPVAGSEAPHHAPQPHVNNDVVSNGGAAAQPSKMEKRSPAAPTTNVDKGSVHLEAFEGMMPDDTPTQTPMDGPPPRQKKSWFKAQPKQEAPKGLQIIKGPDGKMYRLCPQCGRQTRSDDLYMDVFCSNCGKTIPAVTKIDEADLKGITLIGGKGKDRDLTVGFYDGLIQAFTYPIGAIESILLGALVGIAVIVIPVALMMGLIYVMKQEPVNGGKFTVGNWPGMALFCVLMIQLIYCAGVGFYAMIDSIRSTVGGAEKPPSLVWNLTTVMSSLLGYIGFILFYAVLLLAGIWVSGGLKTTPTTLDQVKGLVQGSGMYAYLAILTFFMPMTLIGLATGSGLQGLNPFRVTRSIAGTATHYAFLYCIMLVYAGLIGIAVITMIDFTGQAIADVYKKGFDQGTGSMAMGVVFWGVLMAGGFFGQYVLGRILGLFAREFELKMSFTQ